MNVSYYNLFQLQELLLPNRSRATFELMTSHIGHVCHVLCTPTLVHPTTTNEDKLAWKHVRAVKRWAVDYITVEFRCKYY